MEYRVIWDIDIEADSPLEAAQRALAIQRDPNSTATHFKVRDYDATFHIDLSEPRCLVCGKGKDRHYPGTEPGNGCCMDVDYAGGQRWTEEYK